MNYRNLYIIAILSVFNISCGGGSKDTDDMPVAAPAKATLVFPEANSECNEGTNITDTQSTVLFNWSDAENTTNYQVFVKNLDTNTTENFTSSISEKSITINRGTPYSWYVVSKNTGTETAQSSTFKFYNAGRPTTSHSPFPAELVSPNMGANLATTTSVTLQWKGSDVDNDIDNYTILTGTTKPPTNSEGETTSESIDFTVTADTVYYWQVVTKDTQGNISNSEIFEFKVK